MWPRRLAYWPTAVSTGASKTRLRIAALCRALWALDVPVLGLLQRIPDAPFEYCGVACSYFEPVSVCGWNGTTPVPPIGVLTVDS